MIARMFWRLRVLSLFFKIEYLSFFMEKNEINKLTNKKSNRKMKLLMSANFYELEKLFKKYITSILKSTESHSKLDGNYFNRT